MPLFVHRLSPGRVRVSRSRARELAGSIGHEAALARYEKRLRPFVVANQDIDLRTGEGIEKAKVAFDFDA
jgi:hypothetical protein